MVWSIGIGGTERAAVNYAIAYRQNGQNSKVVVLGEGKERLAELLEAGVETSFVKFDNRGQDAVLSDLKAWKPDILHLHNFTSGLVFYIDRIKNTQTKVVETNVFSRPNYDAAYRVVSLSMQLSDWGYWKYTKWMKGAKYVPETTVVPYVIFPNKFLSQPKKRIELFLQSHGIPAGAFVAGRLGQPHPSKWDMKILKVVEATVCPDNMIYYLFAGMPTNIIQELKNKSAFVQSRVKLIEMIEGDQNLSLFYHSLNCFTHISKIGESFGYVLAEALMCGVPVITMLTPFNDNAQLEVVGNNHGGLCVTSTKKFIAAVKQLYNYPKDCSRIKNNLAMNWISSRFSADAVIPKQINCYRQLLNGAKITPLNVDDQVKQSFTLYGMHNEIGYFFLKFFNSRSAFRFLKWVKK